MSYQTAIDINYSELTNFDEDDFVLPGPGAIRGIQKAFPSSSPKHAAAIIKWMADNQENEINRLGLEFRGLWGRRMHLIDCQNVFCETDKYTRKSMPTLPSNRVRIKSKFNPNPKPISYFFPPKWNLEREAEAP